MEPNCRCVWAFCGSLEGESSQPCRATESEVRGCAVADLHSVLPHASSPVSAGRAGLRVPRWEPCGHLASSMCLRVPPLPRPHRRASHRSPVRLGVPRSGLRPRLLRLQSRPCLGDRVAAPTACLCSRSRLPARCRASRYLLRTWPSRCAHRTRLETSQSFEPRFRRLLRSPDSGYGQARMPRRAAFAEDRLPRV